MIWPITQRILLALLGSLELLIIARAVLSFVAIAVNNSTFHRIYGVICAITDPVLQPIRRLLNNIPFLQGLPVDFSPLIVFLIISFLENAIRWL